MDDVLKFLRYYWRGLVDYALDLAELDDRELQAVELCGRKRMTIEQAAEAAGVSVNTMQARWSSARRRIVRTWSNIEWIRVLAETIE